MQEFKDHQDAWACNHPDEIHSGGEKRDNGSAPSMVGPQQCLWVGTRKLIQKAMDFFHIPEGVWDTYGQFHLRFYTKHYVQNVSLLKFEYQ